MSTLNINRATTTNYGDIAAHTLDDVKFNDVYDQPETAVQNGRFKTDWNAFNLNPKLRAAIKTKAVWRTGNGFDCNDATRTAIDHINGNGKQAFEDIIYNLDVTSQVARDAFAEIITDEKMKSAGNPHGIVNLIVLRPDTIRIVYNNKGQIIRYEQLKPTKGVMNKIKNFFAGEVFSKWEPNEIFHITHDQYCGETTGRSVPESMEKVVLFDDEINNIIRKTSRFQAVPFLMFKIKSDDATTIDTFKANIKAAREDSEDLIIPDDENILKVEPVTMAPSNFLLQSRQMNDKEFYRGVNLPLVLFGTSDQSESGGKVEYAAHEVVFAFDKAYMERQIFRQLGFKVKFREPASLFPDLQRDELKDNSGSIRGQLGFQDNDTDVTKGR